MLQNITFEKVLFFYRIYYNLNNQNNHCFSNRVKSYRVFDLYSYVMLN